MKKKLPWNLIISKLRQNILSEEEERYLNNWLTKDNNQQLFSKIERLWSSAQEKAADYEPDEEYCWKEIMSRVQNERSINNNTLKEPVRVIPLRHFYRISVAASLILGILFFGGYYLGRKNSSAKLYSQTYSSITGKSMLILPDGSEVWLNSNTILSYSFNRKTNLRQVSMKGEAYFEVAHDPQKPFIVNSNGVSVLVHGTKFNVNSYESSNNIIVSLVEGSVSMKAGRNNVLLKPGEEGCFDKKDKTLTVNVEDVDYARLWMKGQLRFENKSLRYVCRYLSKWYSVDISVDPKMPDNQSYTFTLRDESLEDVLKIMARINSFDYKSIGNKKFILKDKVE